MEIFYNYLLDFLRYAANPPKLGDLVLMLKALSLFFSFLFSLAIIFLIFKLRINIKKSMEIAGESIGAAKRSKKRASKEWSSVLKKMEAGGESNFKLAIIEADKILDDILKKSGWPGESMGDRLKQITSVQIANIDAVWQAHKVRNNIVHDPDFHLNRSQAEDAVKIYQKALEELQTI